MGDPDALLISLLGLIAGLGGLAWGLVQRRLARDPVAAQEALRAQRAEIERERAEALLKAKDEADRHRKQLEEEHREKHGDLRRQELRLDQKEGELAQRTAHVEQREQAAAAHAATLTARASELEALASARREALERLAGLTSDEARTELLRQVAEQSELEAAALARGIEEEARFDANRRARMILSQAVERCAVDYVQDHTVAVVSLDGDEQKGRIIGREGRNIRSFEQLTGVDLVIDDTPETVIISAFDPIRREIARQALETLIADGRIHPARIEEVVDRSRRQVDQAIQEAGEAALAQAGVSGLAPGLIRALGRLKYRTSYGQNVLQHSLEVAQLAALMATELGGNVAVCRRAGLLHDLGKGVDGDAEAPHAALGAEIARDHGESEAVCLAIAAHHGDVEAATVEALLVAAADGISAARPGARRDAIEGYTERLERLEAIAAEHDGVEKVFAMQAGRELRVLVRPEAVDDHAAGELARRIAARIEAELAYPGQIKVTVIREQRAVEFAR